MTTLPQLNAASPLDSSDNTRLAFSNDTTETLSRALDDTPTDFGNMDTLSIVAERSLALALSDDTYGLSARIVNGATILAAADSGGTFKVIDSSVTNLVDADSASATFDYVNTTADKTTWDGASLELRQDYSQNMGKDGTHIEVDFVKIDGTYTLAAGTDNLTPSSISSTSHVGQPTIGQEHALSPSAVAAQPSAADTTLGQEHALSPSNVVSLSSVGTPTLSEGGTDNLTPNNIAAASAVGSPTIGQIHDLSPANINAQPVTGTPVLAEIHNLSITNVSSAAVVGTPTLGQEHVFGPVTIVAQSHLGAPTLGEPGGSSPPRSMGMALAMKLGL